MTVYCIGDTHVDERSRFDETSRLLDVFAQHVEAERPDMVIHTGDLYHRASSPRERELACGWLQRLADVCPVVVVRGNHDARHDIEHISRLKATHLVMGVERPDIIPVAGHYVCALPWPTRSMAASHAEALGVDASEGLRSILRWFGAELPTDGNPRILAAHAMVRGSRTSLGQPLTGCDYELGLDDLGLARCSVVALGHIHMRQGWADGSVFYTGSPRRTAFGELESKGFTRIGANHVPQHVELPATPMVLLEADWHDEHMGISGVVEAGLSQVDTSVPIGSEVRLRYNVSADRRSEARLEVDSVRATLFANGAASVVLEERVIAATRARAPEVADARGLGPQLAAYWDSKGFTDADRRERLIAMARSLEESCK